MMRNLRLILLAGIGACAPDQVTELEKWPGVPVIVSRDPVWSTETVELTYPPEMRLGAQSGTGPDVFGLISSLRFLSDGRIAVADGFADEVRVFGSDGAHTATYGGSGEGPNEFGDIGRIYRFPGDSIAAFDYGLARVLVFPASGGEGRSLRGGTPAARSPLFGILASGSLLANESFSGPRNGEERSWMRVLRLDQEAGEYVEILQYPVLEESAAPNDRRALAPRVTLAATRRGFYWARSDRYEIIEYDSLGSPIRALHRPVEPARLDAADRSEYVEETTRWFRERQGDRAADAFRRQMREREFASARPLFGRALVDVDGRLWISEFSWPVANAPARRWSVFAEDGRWQGDVVVPEGFRLFDANGSRVLGTAEDSLGVSFVEIYRVSQLSG